MLIGYRKWLLAALVVVRLHLTWLALLVLPFTVVRRWSERSSLKQSSTSPRPSIEQLNDFVRSCSWRFRYLDTCLIRCLVGARLLNWAGYENRLCVGVRKDEKFSLDAHAWLEDAQGVVIAEQPGQPELFEKIA